MGHVIHLNKGGFGMASKTACGRNVLRTPLSAGWGEFKETPKQHRCEKCETSKQAEVNIKVDAKKEVAELAKWIPVENPDEWKSRDDELVAAHKK